MLRIYGVVIEVVREMRPVVASIERHDKALGQQMRNAMSSVALNLCEGSGSKAGTRTQRYRDALGSAEETRACVHVAEAWGYVGAIDLDKLDHVIRTITKLVK